jgi:hypothetical protein
MRTLRADLQTFYHPRQVRSNVKRHIAGRMNSGKPPQVLPLITNAKRKLAVPLHVDQDIIRAKQYQREAQASGSSASRFGRRAASLRGALVLQ